MEEQESSSSFWDFLKDDNPRSIWLVRVVVTLILVCGYHFFSSKEARQEDTANSSGVPLEDDWKQRRLEALERNRVLEERLEALERDKQELAERLESLEKNDLPVNIESDRVYYDMDDLSDADEDPHLQKEDNEAVQEVTADATTKVEDEPGAKQETDHNDSSENQDDREKSNSNEEKEVDEKNGKETNETSKEKTTEKKSGSEKKKESNGTQTASTGPPPIKATSEEHPGLDQFYHWYNVETSLYRIYELGRTDGVPVVPPFLPKSERGHVPVSLTVGNKFHFPIEVFWVDYKGREVSKGKIPSRGMWHQTTWIGHPWTFRTTEGELLLHYIPYRIIPTTKKVPTTNPDDPDQGLHQFIIGRPQGPWSCTVVDPVLPHPPEQALQTPVQAAQWTLNHLSRTNYLGVDLLTKYLTNIVMHPEETKYRQIRIAQPKFFSGVWNTAARGLLLAVGFVEEQAYAELGTMAPLPRERVRDVSVLLFALEQWKREEENGGELQQPEGADGYGRAGFGRAGQMNLS